jgi:biopolymer transport protein ExbD
MRRRNSGMLPTEVEIPITPMLDMSFNLMAFFVMTFNPSPVEVQFGLNLLPASPVARPGAAPSQADPSNTSSDVPPALKTLLIVLHAAPDGTLARVTIDEAETPLADVNARLKTLMTNPELPFEQVLIQFDPILKYTELITIVDDLAEMNVTKVSFAQFEAGALGPVP